MKYLLFLTIALFSLRPISAAELVPIRVELDWIKNAQFAGLLVALENGWYRDAGLDVTISAVDPKTLETVQPVVEAGGIAIGVADGHALIRARAAG